MAGIIRTSDLVMDYDEKTRALNGVCISIRKGEWATIMGPSGSGKTTLLNIVGCLETPSAGKVVVGDTDITSLSRNELTRFRREHFGFIFQQFHLIPYLTALENVMLPQYFLDKKSVDRERAEEVLERLGLGHRTDHKPGQLSGGEQQRVSIARALICEPEILLADEPTGNLDQNTGGVILDHLKTLHSEGHTILLVTHDRKIGMLGERIINMIDGIVCEDETN